MGGSCCYDENPNFAIMKTLLSIFLLCALNAPAQQHIDTHLKKQLDSILIVDQQYRGNVEAILETNDPHIKDSIAKALTISASQVVPYLMELQGNADSTNQLFIENVFKKYGYPGKTLVGVPTNEVAYYVIQHSDKIGKYIDIIRQAGKKKELPFTLVAMMEDRYLMDNNKEQLYGTQGWRMPDGKGNMENFIWPIKDPQHVNALRKRSGFKTTVEQYAASLGIKYRVVKLSELQ